MPREIIILIFTHFKKIISFSCICILYCSLRYQPVKVKIAHFFHTSHMNQKPQPECSMLGKACGRLPPEKDEGHKQPAYA